MAVRASSAVFGDVTRLGFVTIEKNSARIWGNTHNPAAGSLADSTRAREAGCWGADGKRE
jgi:hypothetical protein